MSHSVGGSGERCEPNLVPILDMVFQLITFFMLVINFKATSVDRELILPVLGSSMPVEAEDQSEVLVLNLRSNGDLYVRGERQPSAPVFIGSESRFLYSKKSLAPGTPLPVRVVIRGDRNIRVNKLLEITDACRANGFEKFDFLVTRSAGKE